MLYYLEVAAIAIVIILVAKYVLKLNSKKVVTLIINSLIGLAILWLINWTGFVSIPLNIVTALITGIFGTPGVIVLVILAFFKII